MPLRTRDHFLTPKILCFSSTPFSHWFIEDSPVNTIMKKLILFAALSFSTSTDAFMIASPSRPSLVLKGTTRPDASEAVKEAMAATEKYGPTSKGARVAWDIVEEMDSSDSKCVE